MREILFRGKDASGKWHYGDLVHNAYDGTKVVSVAIKEKDDYPIEVIPETVGQLWIFNDCRLFGGDLFTAECVVGDSGIAKRLCKVIDSKDGFSPKVWYNGEWWSYSYMNYTTFKHVGNIHDNPELLK